MKLKLASRWPQLTVLIRESFNHTFDWFIQTKQATVFMNESLNHWLAWFVQWGPHLIRQWLVTGHIYAAFKNQSDGKLTLDSDIPSCLPTLKCVLWRQHFPVFGHNRDKQLSLWRSHWIIGSLDSFKRLICSETKQATVLMKESLNHWLTRFIQTAHLFRNEASDCSYEGVTESLAHSIHSNGSFV